MTIARESDDRSETEPPLSATQLPDHIRTSMAIEWPKPTGPSVMEVDMPLTLEPDDSAKSGKQKNRLDITLQILILK